MKKKAKNSWFMNDEPSINGNSLHNESKHFSGKKFNGFIESQRTRQSPNSSNTSKSWYQSDSI